MATTLIVPRGLSEQYYEFLGIASRANREEMIIDRRRAARRQRSLAATAERRGAWERRGPVPHTWTENDLIVVP